MVKRILLLLLVVALLALMWPLRAVMAPSEPPEANPFIPANMSKAVALGCVVAGHGQPQPYAETEIFVRWNTDPTSHNWDFQPVMSRRELAGGGIFKAIDDCREWYKEAGEAIRKGAKEDARK